MDQSTSKAPYPRGHALIVGVAAYKHINRLPAAILNDVNDIAALLASPAHGGYDPGSVRQLVDAAATRSAVLAGLDDLATRTNEDDAVCVYFSGHGALGGGPDADDSSLLMVDYLRTDPAATSISAAELSAALHRIKARRLVVFLDACHAAGAGSLKNADAEGAGLANTDFGFSDKALSMLAESRGRVLMASSRADELSLIMPGARNSAFTAALLEGIGGAADPSGTGEVRIFNLFEYVADKVKQATAAAQHPVFKSSQLELNFQFALSCGGPKSPATDATGQHVAGEWETLGSLMPELYPGGPGDQEIWERAGGDISRLRIQGSGRGTWFAALKTLERGGGGAGISYGTLVNSAIADYPNHPALARLRKA